MAFLDSMNIAASGLTAQKTRLNIISENITNMDTTRTENGDGPYRRKLTVFESTESSEFKSMLNRRMTSSRRGKNVVNSEAGVKVKEIIDDESEFKKVYEPENPDADADGYVLYPNVDLIKETTDAMAATRAYQANITALNSMKDMAVAALEIGR